MADQPKKKPAANKNSNDDRPNRKAFKQKPEDYRGKGQYRGSKTRPTKLTEVQKALLGGGVLRNIHKPIEGSVSGRFSIG